MLNLVRAFFAGVSPLILLCYWQAMFKDVRIARRQFDEGLPPDGRLQSCEKCASKIAKSAPAKPERTHHCSQCRRCAGRMDHHCTFIRNCVGLKNHREFFGLLFYGSLGLTVTLAICVYCAISFFRNQMSESSDGEKIVFVLLVVNACFIVVGIWVACGSLMLYHAKIIVQGRTTLEDMRTEGQPYGFNILANLRDFFGNYWTALLPLGNRFDRGRRKYEGFLFEKAGRDFEESLFPLESFDAANSVLAETSRLKIADARKLLPGRGEGPTDHPEEDDENTIYVFNAYQFT